MYADELLNDTSTAHIYCWVSHESPRWIRPHQRAVFVISLGLRFARENEKDGVRMIVSTAGLHQKRMYHRIQHNVS